MLDKLKVMASNKWTTIGGLLVGIGQYVTIGPGAQMPHTKQDWMHFALGLLIFLWGLSQKDATTGSRPGQPAPQGGHA